MALIQGMEKQGSVSAGVLMEGFWTVRPTSEDRFNAFSAEELREPSACPETSFVVHFPLHPQWV